MGWRCGGTGVLLIFLGIWGSISLVLPWDPPLVLHLCAVSTRRWCWTFPPETAELGSLQKCHSVQASAWHAGGPHYQSWSLYSLVVCAWNWWSFRLKVARQRHWDLLRWWTKCVHAECEVWRPRWRNQDPCGHRKQNWRLCAFGQRHFCLPQHLSQERCLSVCRNPSAAGGLWSLGGRLAVCIDR